MVSNLVVAWAATARLVSSVFPEVKGQQAPENHTFQNKKKVQWAEYSAAKEDYGMRLERQWLGGIGDLRKVEVRVYGVPRFFWLAHVTVRGPSVGLAEGTGKWT